MIMWKKNEKDLCGCRSGKGNIICGHQHVLGHFWVETGQVALQMRWDLQESSNDSRDIQI